MCNQFKIPTLKQINNYLKNDLKLPLVDNNLNIEKEEIFPKTLAPVLLYQNNKLQLQNKSWGYPSPVDSNKVLFNARVERFYESRPSIWKQSFARQRCLILASEFYESGRNYYTAENGKRYKERFIIKNSNYPITMIAGIYDQDHFAMVTTKPNSFMNKIHNRMPMVIEPDELRHWLFQNFTDLINRQNVQLNIQRKN